MERLTLHEARKVFKKFEDKAGFVTKTCEEIASEMLGDDLQDYSEYVSSLYQCLYFYEKEDSESGDSWRFTEDI